MSEKHLTFTDYISHNLETGEVLISQGNLVSIKGLTGAMLHERIIFDTDEEAFVFGIKKDAVEVVLLGKKEITPGTKAVRTGEPVSFPCSKELLGRILSPLGVDLITNHRLHGENRLVDIKATGIKNRVKITEQLETGVMMVDMLLPLGKGQRELVIGDRKTGKTQFTIDTLLHQARKGTVCIYVAIGKSQTAIRKLSDTLLKQGVSDRTVIIATTADDPSGLIYLTPFSGMALAEYFRDLGEDVLIIFDDLTTHARAYREISLLARRFPGRNAYPGDIFYLHARLLERAGNFKDGHTSHSISCLPIAETQQADLAGYLQTNLMSMTDGHLYFDIDRFLEGHRPAVHPFLSVTRVGRQTKTPLIREAISEITSFLSRSERLAQIKHFGQELSDEAQKTLAKAEKFNLLFAMHETKEWDESFQFFILSLLWNGYWITSWDDTAESDIKKLHALIKKHADAAKKMHSILDTKSFTEASKKSRTIADQIFAQYL